jgi:pyocin large subunit-like protein
MMIERTNVLVETTLKMRGVTMVTVSEIKGNYHFNDNSLGGYCTKKPIALALITSKGVKAFSIDGETIEVQDFVNRFPNSKPLFDKRPQTRTL